MGSLLLYFSIGGLARGQSDDPTATFNDLAKRASAALASDPGEAASLYRQALTIQPEWAEGWFYLGASLYGESQYAEAKTAFQKAAKLAPQNGTVLGFLGLCEAQLQESRQALKDLREGEDLGLASDRQFMSKVRNQAALICIHLSDFSAAVEQLRPLAKMADDSEATIEVLGVSTLGFSQSPSELPREKLPLIQLAGRTAWNLYAGHVDEASALARELTAAYPDTPGVHYLCGITILNHDPQAALDQFRNELRIRPDYIPAKMQVAILAIKAGNPRSAAELARYAVQYQPDNPLGHAILGRALLDLRQPHLAIPQFQAAARLSPDNAQVHFYLAKAFRLTGQMDEARKEKAEFYRLNTAKNSARLEYPADSTAPASPSDPR